MKILMITDNFPHDEKPYITPFFSDHAKVLRRIGEVKVITLIRTNRFGHRSYEWEGVPVEALLIPYRAKMGLIFLPLALLSHTFLLVKNLLPFKPDVVVVHMALPAGIPPAVLLRRKFVVVEHSEKSLIGRLNRVLARLVYSSKRYLLTVSRFQAEEIREALGFEADGIVPNPIEGCRSLPPKREIAGKVLFVGTITDRKDPILLREAARLLPEYRFIFVGSDTDREYFRRFVSRLPENCTYLRPFREREEILKIMGEVDMLVSTSKHENFGVAIAEALSCGRPVVWTDSGGPRDFLNEKNSVKVRERTPEAVAEAIREAYRKLREGDFRPEEIRGGILDYASPERVAEIYRRYLFQG